MVEAPRKRVRDYSAERSRRNAEARRWGFTSLDQMSKARRRGEFPTAAVLRKDPSSGIRARQALADKARRAFDATAPGRAVTPPSSSDPKRTPGNAKAHDRESQEWSDMHSRQGFTKFNPRWNAAKKERYYQTFVRPWGKKRSNEQYAAYTEWKADFDPDYDERDDPYV